MQAALAGVMAVAADAIGVPVVSPRVIGDIFMPPTLGPVQNGYWIHHFGIDPAPGRPVAVWQMIDPAGNVTWEHRTPAPEAPPLYMSRVSTPEDWIGKDEP